MTLEQIKSNNFDNLRDAAEAMVQAKAAYEKQWRSFMIDAEADRMSEDRFWIMAAEYRGLVEYAVQIHRATPPEWAADEMMRLALYGSPNYTIDEAIHFALNWRIYVSKFYKAADESDVRWDLSDDGFGDLMDGLVLCGKDFLTRIQNKDFEGRKEFRREATALLGTIASMVLDGENYFGMSLEDAAQKWFLSITRNSSLTY